MVHGGIVGVGGASVTRRYGVVDGVAEGVAGAGLHLGWIGGEPSASAVGARLVTALGLSRWVYELLPAVFEHREFVAGGLRNTQPQRVDSLLGEVVANAVLKLGNIDTEQVAHRLAAAEVR